MNAALHAVRSAWRIDLQEGQAVAVPTPDVHSEFVAAAPREPLEQISQEMRELATGMRQHCERRVAPDANVRIWAAFLDAWAGQLAAARSALPPPELEALSVADTQSLLGADRPISIGKVPTDPIGMRALAAIVRHRVRCSQELPAFWRCTACGCLWRDNRVFHDESVSLSSAKQTSCPECEMKPTAEVCEPLFRQPNVAALPPPQTTEGGSHAVAPGKARHGSEPLHWAVTVALDGEEIVTIGFNHLAGRDLSADDQEAIRRAANNLLGFLGEATSQSDRQSAALPPPQPLDLFSRVLAALESDATQDQRCVAFNELRDYAFPVAALPRAPEPDLEHAAQLLALSLTDDMLETLRPEWGETNVAVLVYWRAEIRKALRASRGEARVQPED